MKYAEMQKLAKKLGVKANMKAEKLMKSLREYISNEQRDLGAAACAPCESSSSTEASTTSESEKEITTTKVSKPKASRKTKRAKKTRKRNNTETLVSEDDLEVSFKVTTPTVRRVSLSKRRSAASVPRSATPKPRVSLSSTPVLPKRVSQLAKTATPKVVTPVRRPSTPKVAAPGSRSRTPVSQPKAKTRGSGQGTKRKRTASLPMQPNDEGSAAKRRSRHKTEEKARSPAVQEMMDSMSEDMTETERKDNLMATLEKIAQEKKAKGVTGKSRGCEEDETSKSTHIPRFTGISNNKKPGTPGRKDWEKIHERQFNKMDSIEDYYSKKRKRAESLTTSVKKVKMMTEQMRTALTSLKKHKTPPSIKKRMAAKVGDHSKKAALFQSPHRGVPFVPKVTSTRKMDLNFGTMGKTPATEAKTPTLRPKTPMVRPKTPTAQSKTPKLQAKTPSAAGRKSVVPSTVSKENSRKSVAATKLQTGTTPFRFTANSMNNSLLNASGLNTTASKPKFDLKASLGRPVTWKMHTGKLNSFKMDSVFTHKNNKTDVKQVTLPTRDDRRKVEQNKRADRRLEAQMKRRGVIN